MKKLTALLLALLMLLCCAACGETAPEKTVPAEPTASIEPAPPAAETAQPEAQPETAGGVPVIGVDTSSMPVTDSIKGFLADAATPIDPFSSTDMLGLPVTEAFFADYALTMVNFWEPWCPPCVGEMPDLQRLYTDYSGKGFTIMGVYSTADGVEEVLTDCGVTYPIVQYVSEFAPFQTGYVPTTIFVNSKGEVISVPVSGSNSYEGWAEIIDYYLG